MKVARWGHALAVCLPAALIEELGLHEGDEITLTPNRCVALDIAFAQRHERATDSMRPDSRGSIDPKLFFDLLGPDETHDQGSAEDRPQ